MFFFFFTNRKFFFPNCRFMVNGEYFSRGELNCPKFLKSHGVKCIINVRIIYGGCVEW